MKEMKLAKISFTTYNYDSKEITKSYDTRHIIYCYITVQNLMKLKKNPQFYNVEYVCLDSLPRGITLNYDYNRRLEY